MSTLTLLPEAASTNDSIRLLMQTSEVLSGTAFATFNQTAGRGQKGNIWHSEPGKNCCYSLLIRPDNFPARCQFLITELVATTVKKVLDEFTDGILIKWPNDIYYKSQKIAGILIENQISGSCIDFSIIGIGLNINETDFPEELPNPVSLKTITNQDYDLEVLTSKLHDALNHALEDLHPDNEPMIRKYYMNQLYRRDGFHTYNDHKEEFRARIAGIDAHGQLMLEREDCTVQTYGFKEIVFV